MQKTFVGVIDQSQANSFVDSRGEKVDLWEIALLLSDSRGMIFNVAKTHEQYDEIVELREGAKVEIMAHSEVKFDGKVKWKLDGFRPLE